MKIKNLIFDLNGVIVDTTEINAQIYARLFDVFGDDVVKQVVEHYKKNGGIPRRERLKYYFEHFVKDPADDKLLDDFSNIFATFYLNELKNANLADGIIGFLETQGNKYKKFISSGAPKDELSEILKILKIKKYFIEAFGAPDNKEIQIAKILEKYDLKPSETVFIGDSPVDKQAAEKNNVIFIHYFGLNKNDFEAKYKLEDFYELPYLLAEIEKNFV